jgi:Transcription factor WhiB
VVTPNVRHMIEAGAVAGPQVISLPTRVLSQRTGVAGLCAGAGGDRWFAPEPQFNPADGRARRGYQQYARAVCPGCPVMAECRELALRLEAQPRVAAHGVWGGLAPWERDRIRRRRREAARRNAAKAVA